MELDEENEGKLFDFCVRTWEKTNKTPSARYRAFRIILKIANKHPELLNEIKFLTQEHYLESLTPGVKHSIRRMIMSTLKNSETNYHE